MTDLQQFRALALLNDHDFAAGVWAGAPALAASGVDMVNNSGGPVEVYITGGTVTFIKIDGATVATASPSGTSASYRLRDGQKLNITYSVAPTLKWFQAP